MDHGLLMSIHGVIMEGLNVKNDHFNADPWWNCGHGERGKVIMEKRMTRCGSLDYLRCSNVDYLQCSFV